MLLSDSGAAAGNADGLRAPPVLGAGAVPAQHPLPALLRALRGQDSLHSLQGRALLSTEILLLLGFWEV